MFGQAQGEFEDAVGEETATDEYDSVEEAQMMMMMMVVVVVEGWDEVQSPRTILL